MSRCAAARTGEGGFSPGPLADRKAQAIWFSRRAKLFMTTWAMILNLVRFAGDDEVLLTVVGGAILVLEIWLLFEAVAAIRRLRSSKVNAPPS